MNSHSYIADDFSEQPYWWDLAPLPGRTTQAPLPGSCDVAIVGGGFTGLMAARTLARAGRHAVVLDAEEAGYGASRRNAGYLGRTLKRSVGWLARHHGHDHAVAIYKELDDALQLVQSVVREEGIDCHLSMCGRFVGATSPAHYEELARDLEESRKILGIPFEMIPRHEQGREIASKIYFGGAVIPDLGSIHPGLYHDGLLRSARAAGAEVHPFSRVTGIEPGIKGKARRVETERGTVLAREVIIATNGYTPQHAKWLSRRVIPFSGYMIATEPLPEGRISELLPNRRTYLDTNMNIDFIRPAPDAERILFGGMTGSRVSSPREITGRLRERLRRILPGIGDVKISRAWTGYCAGTFDFMPHIGEIDGVHFALGYNFAGIPMGTYLGQKLAWKLLGRPEGRSAFEIAAFPTAPFYRGNPWFVPMAMKYFDWKDRRLARQAVETQVR